MATKASNFTYPEFYAFPPFYSKQPNSDTESKRKQLWRDLILSYCRHHRIFALNINLQALQQSPVFCNPSISRTLRPDDAFDIIQSMVGSGLAEWKQDDGNSCYVHWRKPTEWGDMIWRWACDNGFADSVLTLFEIIEGDDTRGTEIAGLDQGVLVKALKALEADGRAALVELPTGTGVKIFSSRS